METSGADAVQGLARLSADARARVLEAFPLVEITARQLLRRWTNAELDELQGVGQLALVECALRHDPNQGALGAFARTRIRGAMLDHLSGSTYDVDHTAAGLFAASCRTEPEEDGYDAEASVFRALDGTSGSPAQELLHHARRETAALLIAAYYAESSAGGEHEFVENETRAERIRVVRGALDGAPERVREVVRQIYEEGLTLEAIAARLATTKKTVWRAHDAAKEAVVRALSAR